uniref:Uncharacterized protein n=1 Tax=Avena sativa TaxID=4498 RepID=A0ACD5X1T1_AVESA
MSEIERDKLSLQEVKGFAKDHLPLKESMKFYFLIPGEELVDGLVCMVDDSWCVRMADYISIGGVVDMHIEYHGEEDTAESSSGSDFQNEIFELSEDDPPDVVIKDAKPAESDTDVLVPDDDGVITQIIKSPVKKKKASIARERERAVNVYSDEADLVDDEGFQFQEMPTQEDVAAGSSGSDSETDVEYVAHSEDSGEDSEVVELRRHARKFKKRMK